MRVPTLLRPTLAGLALALAGCTLHPSTAGFAWEGTPGDAWVRIRNLNGRVEVRRSPDERVVVVANVKTGGRRVTWMRDSSDEAITLCVLVDGMGRSCDDLGSGGRKGLLAWAERRLLAAGRPSMARVIAPAVASLLVLMMVTGAAAPLWRGDGSDNAAMMSRFIEAHVPRSAVIETWEWELSGLGRHTAFHFPDQRYVYLVTAQQGRQLAFDLPYDPLVADPDYLVTGPFSALTGLYRQEVVDRHFSPVAEYPPYVLYARQRDITATGR